MDKKSQGFCIVQQLAIRKSSYRLNKFFWLYLPVKAGLNNVANYKKVHKIRFGKFTWSEF